MPFASRDWEKTPAMITDFRMELNPGPSEYEAVLLRPRALVITSPLPCLSGPASSPTLYHVYVGQSHHLPSTMFKWTTLITSLLPRWCRPASSPLLYPAEVVQPLTMVIPTRSLTLQLSSERPNRLQNPPHTVPHSPLNRHRGQLHRHYSIWSVKLVNHLYTALRLRMRGSIPQTPRMPPCSGAYYSTQPTNYGPRIERLCNPI